MKRSLSLLVFGCLSVNVAFGFSTSDLSKHLGKSDTTAKAQTTKVTEMLTGIDMNNKQDKAMWDGFVQQCVKPSLANMKDVKLPNVKSAKDLTHYINSLTFPKGAVMKIAGKMTSCPQARPIAVKALKHAYQQTKKSSSWW